MIEVLEWLLWACVIAVVAVILGYPAILAIGCLVARRRRVTDDKERSVSLVIAAHNEEDVIESKIRNSLELDYPRDLLEIIVASDGSTDRTNEIVLAHSDEGVVLRSFPRTGKTGVQNRIARSARGEILVFSDANAFYAPDAIRKLVRNFADAEVAGVCGQLVYRTGREGAGRSERSYWDYEKFLKRCESDVSSVVGANGSIYAIRREDYVEIDEGYISDFVEPLALVRNRKRVVYEPEAISVEEASKNYDVEFRRKVRILTRSIVGLLHMRALLNPLSYGIFSIQLIMHKLFRFVLPAFLLTAAAALTALALSGSYRTLFVLVVLAALISLLVSRRPEPAKPNIVSRAFHLMYYFLMVNLALILAWFNVLRGEHMKLWVPERKNT